MGWLEDYLKPLPDEIVQLLLLLHGSHKSSRPFGWRSSDITYLV